MSGLTKMNISAFFRRYVQDFMRSFPRTITALILCGLMVFLSGGVFGQGETSGVKSGVMVQATSHLPLIVVNTYGQPIPDEPKINAHMKVIDNGPGNINSTSDEGNVYSGGVGIEIRGQSSQMFPKKSYGFELRDEEGEDIKGSLLGMPAESDWVLYAPYSDKSLLRNALSYYLGGRMERYQPRFRFCELYINGEYRGIYQLTERIARDKNRVNIAKLTKDDVSGDAVTGGYIVKVDKTQDLQPSEFFTSVPDIRFPNTRNYQWTWDYPKAKNIVEAQRTYFKAYIKNVENTLNGSSFTHPVYGYRQFLDVPSFIDFQIINELNNNVDGYRYSTFFHKERDSKGGKLSAGPLWDFDLAFGNVDYAPPRLATNTWLYTDIGMYDHNCMHWWYRLMQDPEYSTALKQRYSTLRRGVLHTDSIMNWLDSQISYLGEAIPRNYQKWPILNQYVWPNSAVRNTYQAEVTFLKNWITQRLTWLDTQWRVAVAAPERGMTPEVELFPNPFSQELQIALPGHSGNVSIEMFDLRGVRVLNLQSSTSGGNRVIIPAPELESGLYLIRISGEGIAPWSGKVVKRE